ncbi:unnamed protein product, partial [Heterosigma akashiwo]
LELRPQCGHLFLGLAHQRHGLLGDGAHLPVERAGVVAHQPQVVQEGRRGVVLELQDLGLDLAQVHRVGDHRVVGGHLPLVHRVVEDQRVPPGHQLRQHPLQHGVQLGVGQPRARALPPGAGLPP